MIKTRSLLLVSAAVEMATGLALLILPQVVAQLLLGADLPGSGVAISRVCGLALLSLGLACWPEREGPHGQQEMRAVCALLAYNGLVAAYLVYLKTLGGYDGIALLPAILLHALLTILFIKAYSSGRASQPR